MEEIVRRARLRVLYEGADISADIEGMVTEFSCTDNASGKADDLQISLEDRDGLWTGDWFPDKGAALTASIQAQSFVSQENKAVYPCGTYIIDEIDGSGPPSKVSIRAVSSSVKESLRREDKTRAWENVSLAGIAKDIAEENGLALVFDGEDTDFNRVDQRSESDLAFLQRLADRCGMNLKVAEGQIILFEGKVYDAKPPSMSLAVSDETLISWNLSSQAHDVYKACQADYWDQDQKKVLSYTFIPSPAPAVGQTLKVNKRVESLAAAESLAKAELRKKNKTETAGSLQLLGEPRLFAGNTLLLSGFGVFSGSYFLEQVVQSYNRAQGYTTKAKIRQTLGY